MVKLWFWRICSSVTQITLIVPGMRLLKNKVFADKDIVGCHQDCIGLNLAEMSLIKLILFYI